MVPPGRSDSRAASVAAGSDRSPGRSAEPGLVGPVGPVTGTEGRARAGIYIPPFASDQRGHPIDLAQYHPPANASPFKAAYEQMAAYLDGGPQPACTGRDWIMVHETGFAAIESMLTNERVALPNTNRTRRVFADG